MKPAWRTLILAVSFGYLAVMCGPDIRRALGHPLGVTGISIDFHGTVQGTDAQARLAGVLPGDRIDFDRAAPDERFGYATYNTADAGQAVRIALVRGGRHFKATLRTHAEAAERVAMVWLRDGIQVIVAVLATLVLLRRPSPATWGLFFLMLCGCAPSNDVYLLGPRDWRVAAWFSFWISDVVPQYGALFFALHLLRTGPLPPWRRFGQRGAIFVTAAAAAAALWHAYALFYFAGADVAGSIAFITFSTLPFFAAPLILMATYHESQPGVRGRLRWIIAGFLLSTGFELVDLLGSQGNLGIIQMSYVTHSLLTCGVYLSIAIPVAYAVLKHHIIDVNVAISRATVYTALSISVVGLFALVDLFFTRALTEKSAGLIADVALALILGFSFNTVHRRVDSFVDRILFRQRHLAEAYVARLASAMPYAKTQAQVCSMLIDEPVRAFQLSGAKIFSPVHEGVEAMQTLASCLEAERGAVRLTDGEWDVRGFFSENWTAAVALPVFSHNTLDAAVLYGLHSNGSDLDADEVALLEELATAAGSAFDRLEADALRREVATLRSQLRVPSA